jgi:hypothetical protein
MTSDQYPFPVEVPFKPETVQKDFLYLLETEFEDKGYHFGIQLPKHCVPIGEIGQPPAKEGGSSQLAFYSSTQAPGFGVSVEVLLLTNEFSPADLLSILVHKADEEILARNETESLGGAVLDVLSRSRGAERPDQQLVTRRKGIKDRNRFLLVSVFTSEQDYPQVADQAAVILSRFGFLHPVNFPFAENLNTFSRMVPSDFLMMYPASWTLNEEPSADRNILSLRLEKSINNTLIGQNRLVVISKELMPALEDICEFVTGYISSTGFQEPELRFEPARKAEVFESQWLEVTEIRAGPAVAELRATIGERPDAWFVFTLIGPTWKENKSIWAHNRRTQEIMVEFLRTPEHPYQGFGTKA